MTRWRPALLLAVIALGAALRLIRLSDWPPGPWIDEAYFLRAARIAQGGSAPFWGTTPMQPPDFLDQSRFAYFPSNLFLAVVSALDRLGGGGLASMRLVSAALALAVFAASLFLAWASTREMPSGFLMAAFLLATSVWLLTQGRWAWDLLATSAATGLGLAMFLSARRRDSLRASLLSGCVLGLSVYGHSSGRLVFALPLAAAVWAFLERRREETRHAGALLLGALLSAAPLLIHWQRHPERFTAHVGDVSIFSGRAGSPLSAFLANLADYAALFFVRGDPIVRHGDPSRPVFLAGVGLFLLAGLAVGLRRTGPERLLALAGGLFVAGGLLARDTGAANASRISASAPPLLVLSALGAASLAALAAHAGKPLSMRPLRARALVWSVLLVSGVLDGLAFFRWAGSPALEEVFGGRERRLADAVMAERTRAPADILLHPHRAARNVYLVDVLLGRPGDGGRHAVRVGTPGLETSWLFVPRADLLYAADAGSRTRAAVERLGGRLVAVDQAKGGGAPWGLFRIPRAPAGGAAAAALDRIPRVEASSGGFEAPEEGLYVLSARGPLAVALGQQIILDTGARPGEEATLHLAAGRHPLRVLRAEPGASLRILAPDGFVLPAE